jgi:hypothetical protein
MTTLPPASVPYTGPYSVEGHGKHKGNTALALKRAMSRLGYLPWEPTVWDDAFNAKLEAALDRWDPAKDGYAEGRWAKLRRAKMANGDYALDAVSQKLIRDEYKASTVKVPDLGPIFHGGASVLQHDLTHPTDGIPLYPAFDDAFAQGTGIIAPENMTVTRSSSSRPGDACYCIGDSKLRYWFGHLAVAPAVGRELEKGDKIGNVAPNHIGGGPHCHVGINVEVLMGAGRQLIHHDNYTHGAPLIGAQLEAWYSL